MTPEDRYKTAELIFWSARMGDEIGPWAVERFGSKATYWLEKLARDLEGLLNVVRAEYTPEEKRNLAKFMATSHFYILPDDETPETEALLAKEREWLAG